MPNPMDESLPDELEEVCTVFHQRVQDAKKKLAPLVDTPRDELHEAIGEDLVQRANLDLTVAYATTSLYWCYLCTQGVSTAEHPVKRELERIRKAMTRCKDVQVQLRGRTTTVNQQAAKRIVHSGTRTPGKQQQQQEDSRLNKQRDAQDRAMAKRARSSSPSSLREAAEKRRKT